MKNSAVTDSAPAPERETPQSMDETVETGFLPTDEHYRLTGQFKPEKEDAPAAPPKEPQEKEPADIEGAPATSESDIAAASEAAQAQERKGKTAATSESRWAKITRENRELREKLAAKDAASVKETPRETKQDSQPAAEAKPESRPEPKMDDVDPKTGKTKYQTYEDFQRDQRKWDREEALREFQETSAKTTKEKEVQQHFEAVGKELAKKFTPVRAKYADFDAVALNPDLVMPMGSVTDLFIQDSDHAGEVAYHLGQHPEILEGFYGNFDKQTGKFINLVSPQQQFRKLMAIEAEVSGSSEKREAQTPPVKPVTQAPRPPNQVSGKGTVAKDAVEQAVEDQDQETYMREANARELARRNRR